MGYIFGMPIINRIHNTAVLIICSLAPRASSSGLLNPGRFSLSDGKKSLFYQNSMPIAAPFILFRLKRNGFSNCKVMVADGGLLVSANR